jgi:hypothetical protein
MARIPVVRLPAELVDACVDARCGVGALGASVGAAREGRALRSQERGRMDALPSPVGPSSPEGAGRAGLFAYRSRRWGWRSRALPAGPPDHRGDAADRGATCDPSTDRAVIRSVPSADAPRTRLTPFPVPTDLGRASALARSEHLGG